MKRMSARIFFTLILVTGCVAMTLTGTSASASYRPHVLHVTKNCSGYTGAAGAFCTVTTSNVRAIAPGSRVFYFQPLIPSTGVLDSNIVLDAGSGNRAVGRCTLDLATNLALCTFSDGTGILRGFHARIDGSGPFGDYHWDGIYSFEGQLGERDGDHRDGDHE